MRNELDLFVNVLHCKSVPAVKTRHDNIDVVVVRQNTEGEYAMLEHQNVNGVVESLKIVSATNTKRLVTYAFEYAEVSGVLASPFLYHNAFLVIQAHGRKKVTLVHKANIMKLTDGLFLHVATEVAKNFPKIEFDNMIIDNCCMQLVSNPW